MPCVHLVKLYQLCEKEGIKLGSADLIHIVCEQCGEKEVCPSVLTDEYDSLHKNDPVPTSPPIPSDDETQVSDR